MWKLTDFLFEGSSITADSDCSHVMQTHLKRPCGEGNGNPLQYSCLENPRPEEPGGLQSMGWRRVRHNSATKEQPSPPRMTPLPTFQPGCPGSPPGTAEAFTDSPSSSFAACLLCGCTWLSWPCLALLPIAGTEKCRGLSLASRAPRAPAQAVWFVFVVFTLTCMYIYSHVCRCVYILADLIWLRFTNSPFFPSEALWQPCIERVGQCHFPNSICLLHVSVSHFGSSRNTASFFLIITFVMMVCDWWSWILLLWKD